jgi:hypothetical protein
LSFLDKKIDNLMCEPFATYHDTFIENYLNTLEPRILNRERFIFGLNKNKYSYNFIYFILINIKKITNKYSFSFLHTCEISAIINTWFIVYWDS